MYAAIGKIPPVGDNRQEQPRARQGLSVLASSDLKFINNLQQQHRLQQGKIESLLYL